MQGDETPSLSQGRTTKGLCGPRESNKGRQLEGLDVRPFGEGRTVLAESPINYPPLTERKQFIF